jgi:hypothetical protein
MATECDEGIDKGLAAVDTLVAAQNRIAGPASE